VIRELDIVTLTRDLPNQGLLKNSQGAVVHCYADGQGFEVEFVGVGDEPTAVLTLESSDIQIEPETIRVRVLDLSHSPGSSS